MKCYFHFDEKTGKKILIPYCWSVLWSDDIRDCRCESETFSKFENRKYNEVLEAKETGKKAVVFIGSMMDIFEGSKPLVNSKGEKMIYTTASPFIVRKKAWFSAGIRRGNQL